MMQTTTAKRPFAPPAISTTSRRRRNKPAAPPKPDGHTPQRSTSLRMASADAFVRKSPPPTPPRMPHHRSTDFNVSHISKDDLPPRVPRREHLPTHSVCSSSTSGSNTSAQHPHRLTFTPNHSGRTADEMEIIDESKTQSKADAHLTAEIVDNYGRESMYSSEDDLPADKEETSDIDVANIVMGTMSPSATPSISVTQYDDVQRYKQYGPKIKLLGNSSIRDDVRYHNALDIETTNQFRSRRGGGGSGYDSDQSDESISRISQSYGVHLFDANYKANLHKMHSSSRTHSYLMANH